MAAGGWSITDASLPGADGSVERAVHALSFTEDVIRRYEFSTGDRVHDRDALCVAVRLTLAQDVERTDEPEAPRDTIQSGILGMRGYESVDHIIGSHHRYTGTDLQRLHESRVVPTMQVEVDTADIVRQTISCVSLTVQCEDILIQRPGDRGVVWSTTTSGDPQAIVDALADVVRQWNVAPRIYTEATIDQARQHELEHIRVELERAREAVDSPNLKDASVAHERYLAVLDLHQRRTDGDWS